MLRGLDAVLDTRVIERRVGGVSITFDRFEAIGCREGGDSLVSGSFGLFGDSVSVIDREGTPHDDSPICWHDEASEDSS